MRGEKRRRGTPPDFANSPPNTRKLKNSEEVIQKKSPTLGLIARSGIVDSGFRHLAQVSLLEHPPHPNLYLQSDGGPLPTYKHIRTIRIECQSVIIRA